MAKSIKEDDKAILWEVGGILLFGLTVYLVISLSSYSPSDPSINTVRITKDVHNWGGRLGAYLADILLTSIGISAFIIPLALIFLSVEMVVRKRLTLGLLRPFAFLFFILSLSGLLSLYIDEITIFDTKIASGGLIGEILAPSLRGYLNTPGATVVLVLIFIVSAVVTTGVSLIDLIEWTRKDFIVVFQKIGRWITTPRKQKTRPDKRMEREEKKEATPTIAMHKRVEEPIQETLPFIEAKVDFHLPPLSLLDDHGRERSATNKESFLMNAKILEKKLAHFGVEGKVKEVRPGPVITLYEFEPAPGVKINSIVNLADDLALALRALSVRIIAPIPGKAAVGIEIPNNEREMVSLRDIVGGKGFREHPSPLSLALGKDIEGRPVIADLTKMPHLLIAGSTGAGKSVSLNAMILSILYKATPKMVRFVMIDPKRLELSIYNPIPHLLLPVVTEAKKATPILRGVLNEMEERYQKMAELGVRNIDQFNRQAGRMALERLPYIVVVIDEMADLMMTAKKDFEDAVIRLAQMARAAGIHLIVATQRPSVDVITGLIKANFPARIAFQVPSRTDSRTILDTTGAERLLGEGDMLFLPPGTSRVQRVHGAFVSEAEIKRVVDFLAKQERPEYHEEILNPDMVSEKEGAEEWDDDLYNDAVRLVKKTGQASISFIQRRLRIGYNRAARMVERMEKEGIVGPAEGSRPREVLERE